MARLAKLSSKKQITLPKAVLSAFPDVEYFDVSVGEGGIWLKPLDTEPVSPVLKEVREHFKRLGLGPKDIEDAIKWARSTKAPR